MDAAIHLFWRALAAVYLVLVISNYLALDVFVPDLPSILGLSPIYLFRVLSSPSTSRALPEFRKCHFCCLFLRLGKTADFSYEEKILLLGETRIFIKLKSADRSIPILHHTKRGFAPKILPRKIGAFFGLKNHFS